VIRLLQLLHAVAKGSATDKTLITLDKSLAVVLLQRFRRVVPANFNLAADRGLELPDATFGNRCNSTTAGDFQQNINAMGVALCFATGRNSHNRGPR
jgi:hypothetical protein